MTTQTSPTSDLRKLSEALLIETTHRLAKEERRITLELLWHIREIDRRKIPHKMGMSGIFDYCVRVLNYSEGSAFRRVQSMRALDENPELEKSIIAGKMNLTTASQLQTFLQRAKRQGIPVLPPLPQHLTKEDAQTQEKTQKADFFSSFEGLSSRRVEQKLSEISPTLARREHERLLNEHELEVRLTVSSETKRRWVRISELAAHRMNFDPSTRRIVELSAEMAVSALEKEKVGKHPETVSEKINAAVNKEIKNPSNGNTTEQTPAHPSRRISAPLRRLIWWRDQGRCTYHSPATKTRCASRFALEIDHIKPFSLGGSSIDAENLRLLCKSHHQMMTEKTFKAEVPHRP